MPKETFQLADNAAEIYEEQKVPAVFRPLALATLEAVRINDDDKVLDVACGTGVVAREVAAQLGPSGSITGVDLNESMIQVARSITADVPANFQWVVADATTLPFETGTFSLVICQQGIQFFPDEQAALNEFRRILSPRGRVALTIWDGASDFAAALSDALSRHVGDDVAKRSLAPFQYSGMETLPQRMSRCRVRRRDGSGYDSTARDQRSRDRHSERDPRQSRRARSRRERRDCHESRCTGRHTRSCQIW